MFTSVSTARISGRALQQLESLVGILRLDDPDFRFAQDIDLSETNQRLVFDHEDDRLIHDAAMRLHAAETGLP